ncbi:alpha/beta fold hydrolase [Kribbella sp. NPDC026596]|uniref:esterase/lipase family protein n=1 Tax=Kribbella sp. NPDC026596 TaxID=3155122 RepID=UPI0033E21749
MSEQAGNALPIVLIHGLWMTARSWDRWVEHYRAKGHEVIAPSWTRRGSTQEAACR